MTLSDWSVDFLCLAKFFSGLFQQAQHSFSKARFAQAPTAPQSFIVRCILVLQFLDGATTHPLGITPAAFGCVFQAELTQDSGRLKPFATLLLRRIPSITAPSIIKETLIQFDHPSPHRVEMEVVA